MAMSLDGYIARKDGDIDWLTMAYRQGEDYGFNAFYNGIDTVVIGRKTYEKIVFLKIEYPYKGRKCYVVSKTLSTLEPWPNIEIYSGDLKELIEKLKAEESNKHILIDGGARLIHEMAKLHLIDYWIISILPIILGSGIRLFIEGCPEQQLKLVSSKHFETGLVLLEYETRKDKF